MHLECSMQVRYGLIGALASNKVSEDSIRIKGKQKAYQDFLYIHIG